MKLLIQRVIQGQVTVEGQIISKISKGIVVLLGIHIDDDETVAKKLALKLPKVRLWANSEGKAWSAGAADLDYEILIVSQFTLYNTMKGNKPDFHLAQKADEARRLYEYFIEQCGLGYKKERVFGGKFQAMMEVHIVNDGPVTIEIEDFPEKKNNIKQQKEVKPQVQQQQTQQFQQPQSLDSNQQEEKKDQSE